jgi:hypothetical protein
VRIPSQTRLIHSRVALLHTIGSLLGVVFFAALGHILLAFPGGAGAASPPLHTRSRAPAGQTQPPAMPNTIPKENNAS